MNHLKLVTQKQDTNSTLQEVILKSLKEKNIVVSDSDMFAYCNFYTGDFWVSQLNEKMAA